MRPEAGFAGREASHPFAVHDAEGGGPRGNHGFHRARHRSTANVNVPRAASSEPTCAVALPRPIGPRTWSISHTRESVSPGETTRLKRQSSIPAKNAIRP